MFSTPHLSSRYYGRGTVWLRFVPMLWQMNGRDVHSAQHNSPPCFVKHKTFFLPCDHCDDSTEITFMFGRGIYCRCVDGILFFKRNRENIVVLVSIYIVILLSFKIKSIFFSLTEWLSVTLLAENAFHLWWKELSKRTHYINCTRMRIKWTRCSVFPLFHKDLGFTL